ncbi:MAG: hypothetical protein H0U85_01715 [Gemmatimonadales bacterium]|nr:hypothetical protein [Gemmatimonadales bacterium]
MDELSPDNPGQPSGEGAGPAPVALAVTDSPVLLHVALVEDERTPAEMVCMGTYLGERLVARCVMPPEAWAQVLEYGLFDAPVKVALVAREEAPGLQCQLYAMVPIPDAEDEEEEAEEEPWAASVPGAGYEAAIAGDAEDEDEEEGELEEEAVTALPLGNIVRFARDRVHPDSLPHEAADVLMKVIEGKTSEVVDRALSDLLGL